MGRECANTMKFDEDNGDSDVCLGGGTSQI
jgi:hypothetical protein